MAGVSVSSPSVSNASSSSRVAVWRERSQCRVKERFVRPVERGFVLFDVVDVCFVVVGLIFDGEL